MTWFRTGLPAAVLLAVPSLAHTAVAATAMPPIPGSRSVSITSVIVVTVVALGLSGMLSRQGSLTAQPRFRGYRVRFALGAPLVFLALASLDSSTGILGSGWVALPLWSVLTALFVALGGRLGLVSL